MRNDIYQHLLEEAKINQKNIIHTINIENAQLFTQLSTLCELNGSEIIPK